GVSGIDLETALCERDRRQAGPTADLEHSRSRSEPQAVDPLEHSHPSLLMNDRVDVGATVDLVPGRRRRFEVFVDRALRLSFVYRPRRAVASASKSLERQDSVAQPDEDKGNRVVSSEPGALLHTGERPEPLRDGEVSVPQVPDR